mmetsp:Transcript_31991/g.38711  ORF Transcript_31991/g.38711 Transcript_31991/m.38711 type:complete len:403 (-) Transcript_31991:633-1841(-)|eukprot:CAMPEP_0197854084 /NCGR_PEP_ID=MMETSP1438-20131217/24005_1 /TAXON_ID=1461541 /ORGANISM="Pterosperma sp., Strain CCMP1384" /LENGTH=402 /DNA_ID=CAMNT_0043468721 /DNA_START=96 /DNA_END=1304 /DNA_ORIENTATION=+
MATLTFKTVSPVIGKQSSRASNSARMVTRAAMPGRYSKTTLPLHRQFYTPEQKPFRLAVARQFSRYQQFAARAGLVVRAADDAAGASAEESRSWGETLYLGALFGGWYLFNIWFNIYNKQVLKVFPYPWTCTLMQFAIGITIVCTMWVTRAHSFPKVDKETLLKIVPLAGVHALGNLLTNVSLGKVAVSFTHTIKAMEPFFSVALSAIFLGDTPTLPIVASLLPIVFGVALASCTESSFNWAGFLAAMGSNLTFQSRNVLSKKLMGSSKDKKDSIDNINLFSIITIMSFLLLAPFTLFMEGIKFTPAEFAARGIDATVIGKWALYAGICFHMYQQVSYMILQRVSPVTHSVGNCVKRVVVIVSSVIFFATPVSPLNAVGTVIALGGVFAYSQVKRLYGKKTA